MAPSIWELDDVKKGVLCLMFGGTNKRVVPGTYHQMTSEDIWCSVNRPHLPCAMGYPLIPAFQVT